MSNRFREVWFRGLVSLGCLFLFSDSLQAASFQLNTDILGQARENEKSLTEVPVNGYLGMALSQPKWHLQSETDMRLVHDFARKWDDYDLYQAVLHFRPIEMVQVDFGRQLINEGFSMTTLDGLRVVLMPSGYVDVTVYSGIPRSVERGDFNQNDGLLSGLAVGLKNVPRTHAQLQVAWRKNDIHQHDLRENDSILLGLNLSHQSSMMGRPMLYGLVEGDVTGRSVDAGTLGMDLYPFRWVSLNAEFNYFDINRSTNRPTIFSLFSHGPLLMGRVASTWTVVPDFLYFVESYTHQQFEIQDSSRQSGNLIDSAFQLSIDRMGMSLEPGYYFSQSFGGHLHGARLSVHEQFTEKFYADAGFDFTNYRKVTNNNDSAFSTVLWTGYELPKGVTLSAGFEFNRNNLFNQDIRGSFRLDYRFHHET